MARILVKSHFRKKAKAAKAKASLKPSARKVSSPSLRMGAISSPATKIAAMKSILKGKNDN